MGGGYLLTLALLLVIVIALTAVIELAARRSPQGMPSWLRVFLIAAVLLLLVDRAIAAFL